MEQKISESQAPRAELMKLLDSHAEKHIIYIHAPAGFGKTVSSFLWLERREALSPGGIKRAVVSLDEYDDKTSEFCRRFISALSALQPENTVLNELAAYPIFKTAPVEVVLHIINAFSETQEKYVLVLDDLHVIKNEEILKILPVLFKRLSGNFTVLLLSRSAPPDSFSEIAAKGELAIVDAGHLQFTVAEIKNFFNINGKLISNKQADEILASTGGWAIGLRALLLSEEKDYKVELTGRYLENFLKSHVWERWDDKYRVFMVIVSVAEELTPELCRYLAAGIKTLKNAPIEEMLTELVRENVFLRIVGNNSYKFHDLFREFLFHMLEQQGEQALNKQYNKAGKYFFGKKDYFRSVQYYLKSKNNDGVAESIYHMQDYNSPYTAVEDTLNAVKMSLNETLIEKHPFLLEGYAWSSFMDGRADECEKAMDKYYKLLPKIILKTPRSAITHMLLRCLDYRVSIVNILKKLQLVPFKGSIRASTPSITQSLPFFHRSVRDFSDMHDAADKSFALAEKTIGVVIGEEFSVLKECLYAGLHYEKGNLNEAQSHALSACANIQDGFSSEMKFCAMIILASSFLACGQTKNADKILCDTEDMIKQDNALYLTPNFRAYKFTIRLSNGDSDAAREWLSLYAESPHNHLAFYKIFRHFTTARAYIVMGDYSMAILLLKKLLALAESYKRPIDIVEALILLAISNWKEKRGGLNVAMDYLERAAVTAYEYKYTQVFSNEGAELTTMLHRYQKRAQQSSYTGDVPADFVKSLYIAAVVGTKNFKGLTSGRPPENLKFTDKQKEVMRLMCAGYSRNEIAAKTGLKPNGVKSHTTLIYKKLNVPNSIEAVLRIKELGLVF